MYQGLGLIRRGLAAAAVALARSTGERGLVEVLLEVSRVTIDRLADLGVLQAGALGVTASEFTGELLLSWKLEGIYCF